MSGSKKPNTLDGVMTNFHSDSRRQLLASGLGLVGAAASGPAAATPLRKASTLRMDAYEIGSQAGVSSLRRVVRPRPAPKPGQVLVKVRAAALNHRDLYIMSAQYGARKAQERIPLGDGAGEIAALGDGVSGFALGERVTAPHFQLWIDGAFRPEVYTHDAGNTITTKDRKLAAAIDTIV